MIETLKSLPHSEEAEQAVLGAVLLEPSILQTLGDKLRPEDFYLEKHSILFVAFQSIDKAGQPLDLRTVQSWLERHGKAELCGGISYLASLDLALPDIGRVEVYAGIVRENALRRALIDANMKAVRAIVEGADLPETVSATQHALAQIQGQATPATYKPLRDLASQAVDDIEARWEHGALMGIETPWPSLNAILDHIKRGEMLIVSGAPGFGKTSWLKQLAKYQIDKGKSTAIISLEMQASELTEGLLSLATGIPYSAIRSFNRRLTREQHSAIVRQLNQWTREDAPLEIDDSPFQTAKEICDRLRRLHRCERGIDLFMIDYGGLIKLESSNNRDLELMASVNMIRGVAKELGVPSVVFTQVTGDAVKDAVGGKAPRALSQTAGGQAFPQAAYCQIYLQRDVDPATGAPQERGKFIITKHRGGPTGVVYTNFDGPTMQWKERDKDAFD